MSDEDLEVDVEVEVEAEAVETSDDQTSDRDDQFDKAENATQKRIDRLTKKMREAERREGEAVNYAKQVQQENQTVKARMANLDNSYVTEYSSRVTTQADSAEKELTRAMEIGDTAGAVEAQRRLTGLAIEQDRARQAKMQQDRYRQQAEAQQQANLQQPMPQQAQAPRRPDPKAETWAVKNDWFGQDEVMTYAAFGIHKKLVEDEGFDPQGNDYYTELDRRIAKEFPHKLGKQGKRPAQAVASASRTSSGRSSGRKVRLTPSQVAIAKKLGVPLSEYAKYVKE